MERGGAARHTHRVRETERVREAPLEVRDRVAGGEDRAPQRRGEGIELDRAQIVLEEGDRGHDPRGAATAARSSSTRAFT